MLAIAAAVAVAAPASAQWTQAWRQTWGPGPAYFQRVAATPDGGAAVLASNFVAGRRAWSVLRYDADGKLQWARTASSAQADHDPADLLVDPRGRLWIFGVSRSTELQQALAQRLGADGRPLQTLRFANPRPADPLRLLRGFVDAEGNATVFATGFRPATGADLLAVQFAPTGARRWTTWWGTAGNVPDEAAAASPAPGRSWIFAGNVRDRGVAVLRIGWNGVILNAHTPPAAPAHLERCAAVAVDPQGNVAVVGSSQAADTGVFVRGLGPALAPRFHLRRVPAGGWAYAVDASLAPSGELWVLASARFAKARLWVLRVGPNGSLRGASLHGGTGADALPVALRVHASGRASVVAHEAGALSLLPFQPTGAAGAPSELAGWHEVASATPGAAGGWLVAGPPTPGRQVGLARLRGPVRLEATRDGGRWTGRVRLSSPAEGPTVVRLSASPGLRVPPSVSLARGQSEVAFPIEATASAPRWIAATLGTFTTETELPAP